jgi:hypothetical protein
MSKKHKFQMMKSEQAHIKRDEQSGKRMGELENRLHQTLLGIRKELDENSMIVTGKFAVLTKNIQGNVKFSSLTI